MSSLGSAAQEEQDRMLHTPVVIIGMELEMTLEIWKGDPRPVAAFLSFSGSVAVIHKIKQAHEIIRLQTDRFLKRSDRFGILAGIGIEKSEREMTHVILRVFPDEFSCSFLRFGKLTPVHVYLRERIIDREKVRLDTERFLAEIGRAHV